MSILDIAIYAAAALACFSIGATLGMAFAWYTAREQAADLRRRFTWEHRPPSRISGATTRRFHGDDGRPDWSS
jgi:hypothetical protein